MYTRLEIELVPATSFYNNVRNIVSKEQWDFLRKECYKKANYKCEICGERGDKWSVECHELWEYDDIKHIQKLVRLIALCPNCHKVKHFGHTEIMGKSEEALTHLMKVNNINKEKALEEVDKSFELWAERSEHDWEVDISFLDNVLYL
jgi:5-methylcytosine-specific restriction endonuclease McrA